MNSTAMSLAALMRSGVKSRASMLVDTSIANTMSMPSVSTFSVSVDERGRAMATMMRQRAAMRRMKGRCRSQARVDLPPASQGCRLETRMCGRLPPSSCQR